MPAVPLYTVSLSLVVSPEELDQEDKKYFISQKYLHLLHAKEETLKTDLCSDKVYGEQTFTTRFEKVWCCCEEAALSGRTQGTQLARSLHSNDYKVLQFCPSYYEHALTCQVSVHVLRIQFFKRSDDLLVKPVFHCSAIIFTYTIQLSD